MTAAEAADAELAHVAERARAALHEEHVWEAGPILRRDLVRFAEASFDVESAEQLDAGGPVAVAPPLFLTSILAWDAGAPVEELRPDGLSDREAPYVGDAVVRLVHGGQQLTWHRFPTTEDVVVARRRLGRADLRRGRAGELLVLDLATSYATNRGEELAKCIETVLCLPAGGEDHARTRPAAEVDAEAQVEVEVRFDLRQMLRFSAVTWNTHRIHVDPDFARFEGFDGPVVQSSLHGITLLRAARRWLSSEQQLVQFSWRNRTPVVAGQVVRAGAVSDHAPAASGTRRVAVRSWTSDGVVAAEGLAVFAG